MIIKLSLQPDKPRPDHAPNLAVCGGHGDGHGLEAGDEHGHGRHPLHAEAHGRGHSPGDPGAHHRDHPAGNIRTCGTK